MRKKIKIKVALLFFGVAACAVIGGVCYEGMRFVRVTERASLLRVGDRQGRVRELLGTPTGVCESPDPWAAVLLDVPPERWSYSTSFTDLLHIETSPGPERVVIDFDEHRRVVKIWIP